MISCTHIHVLAATDTNEIKSNKLFLKRKRNHSRHLSWPDDRESTSAEASCFIYAVFQVLLLLS